jgi:hypothetical protein
MMTQETSSIMTNSGIWGIRMAFGSQYCPLTGPAGVGSFYTICMILPLSSPEPFLSQPCCMGRDFTAFWEIPFNRCEKIALSERRFGPLTHWCWLQVRSRWRRFIRSWLRPPDMKSKDEETTSHCVMSDNGKPWLITPLDRVQIVIWSDKYYKLWLPQLQLNLGCPSIPSPYQIPVIMHGQLMLYTFSFSVNNSFFFNYITILERESSAFRILAPV